MTSLGDDTPDANDHTPQGRDGHAVVWHIACVWEATITVACVIVFSIPRGAHQHDSAFIPHGSRRGTRSVRNRLCLIVVQHVDQPIGLVQQVGIVRHPSHDGRRLPKPHRREQGSMHARRAEKQHVGRRNGRDQRHGNRDRRSLEKRKLAWQQRQQQHWQQQPVQVVLTDRNLVLQTRRDDSTHAVTRAVTRRFVASSDHDLSRGLGTNDESASSSRDVIFSSLSPEKSRVRYIE